MFCMKCGSEITDGAAFCPSCGAIVSQPAQMPPLQTERRQESDNGRVTKAEGVRFWAPKAGELKQKKGIEDLATAGAYLLGMIFMYLPVMTVNLFGYKASGPTGAWFANILIFLLTMAGIGTCLLPYFSNLMDKIRVSKFRNWIKAGIAVLNVVIFIVAFLIASSGLCHLNALGWIAIVLELGIAGYSAYIAATKK